MPNLLDLQAIAHALSGHVSQGQVLAPGPGHSAGDRSMSLKLSDTAQDGFAVHSFAGDNPIKCRDYVREKLGLPTFKPNGARHSNDNIDKIVMAIAAAQTTEIKKIVATYDYTDENGTLLYQVARLEPKSFRHRRPDGKGGWIWQKSERAVLYRWPDILKNPDGTVFICEGEKDADRVAGLNLCATTVAGGKWTQDCIEALRGRDCIIFEDNDETGSKKALDAATAFYGVAKTIRIVRFPDLPEKGDVSDWLDAHPHNDDKPFPVQRRACSQFPSTLAPPSDRTRG